MCLGGYLYPTFTPQVIFQDPFASTVHHGLLSTSGESNGASKEEAQGGSGNTRQSFTHSSRNPGLRALGQPVEYSDSPKESL